MKIEISEFEAQCASLKLRGIKTETIVEILQENRDYEIQEGIVEDAIKRAGKKLQKQLEQPHT
jgi:hypothetical protein